MLLVESVRKPRSILTRYISNAFQGEKLEQCFLHRNKLQNSIAALNKNLQEINANIGDVGAAYEASIAERKSEYTEIIRENKRRAEEELHKDLAALKTTLETTLKPLERRT